MEDKFDISEIELSKNDIKRGLILPTKPSKELSEFIGILTGDGYINSYKRYNHIMEITGNLNLDRDYLTQYTTRLIKGLFNLEPTIISRKNQNAVYIRLRSKGLVGYLKKIGFKKGKKNQIGVPKWILNNDKYFVSFIKGLSDTDFSLNLLNRNGKKYKYYPRINLNSKSKILVKELDRWLIKKGFSVYTNYDRIQKDKRGYNDSILHSIQINGRKNLDKWMSLISFRNKKHLDKFNLLKFGSGEI